MRVAWHSSGWWDWCASEDEKKKRQKIVGIGMDFFVSDDRIQKYIFFAPKRTINKDVFCVECF